MDPNYVIATIVDRREFSEDVLSLRFSLAQRPSFKPGQYCTLALEVDGQIVKRPYSVASAPDDEFLELYIDLVRQGTLTPRLWNLQPGDEVRIRGRFAGSFLLDTKAGITRHIFCATVTGAAPFVSMIRDHAYALKRGESRPYTYTFIHGASFAEEFGTYRTELASLAQSGWLTYIPTVSRPWENPHWSGEKGRVEDVLRKHTDGGGLNYENAVAYACGNPTMIKHVKEILHRAGFPLQHIHEEKYFTPQV